MQQPTAFLFDLDGTLVDSLTDLATAINLLRHELSLPPLDLPSVRSYVGDGATALVRRALPPGSFTNEKLERFLNLYCEHLLDTTRLYPGILDFLARHRQQPLAVVTNKPLGLTRKLLSGLELDHYFPVVVGGDSCAEKKPSPVPVRWALERLGVEATDAVLIGDHHTDLSAGQAAGVRTCFCRWGLGERGGIDPDFQADTAEALLQLFPGKES